VCFADDSPGGKTILEVKVSPLHAAQDQAIAQVIVFSLLQKQKHPELAHHLIPNIVISTEEFQIFMYDSVNDILLGSKPSKLFDDKKCLYVQPVIILWLVLHYREFSHGISVQDADVDVDFKSSFKERAGPKWDVYSRLLKENVSFFPIVTNNVELNQDFFENTSEVHFK
jgi:hypothetical protein